MENIQLNYETKNIIHKLIEEKQIPAESSGVFSLKDCILVESFTGKNYTYRVVNFVTGDQKYLFYKKQAIEKEVHCNMVERMTKLDFYNMKRASDGFEMIDVIFKEIFPKYGFTVRHGQVDLSKHMYKNLRDERIDLSDVAVGLGKTHAYLVAAIVQGIFSKTRFKYKQSPIVITTSSIELQHAIINEYIPEISKMLLENGIIATPILCVLRKGKENYLCPNRLRDYFYSLDPERKRPHEYKGLQKLMRDDLIDLGEITGISGYDKRKINVKSNLCFNCSNRRTCAFQVFMKQARKSSYHFQICNHNYYLADVLKRKDNRRSLLPNYKAVIIDEAHKLRDAANQMYGTSISEYEINQFIKKVMPNQLKEKWHKDLKNLCYETLAFNQLLFDELVNQIPKYLFNEETEKFATQITVRIKLQIEKIIFCSQEIRMKMSSGDPRVISEISRIIKKLKTFINEESIYWMENPKAKGQRILSSIPVDISSQLGSDLWNNEHAMILTSGTLAVEGQFDYMKRQTGLDQVADWRIEELYKSTPFDFKKNCMLYIADSMPYPKLDDERYITEVGEEIKNLILASNGHALVLFTSYKPLRMMYQYVREQTVDIPLFVMNRGKSDVLDKFKQSGNGVLFATGSMWEGVNIPGDILSHLIIVKLPFPVPDPVTEYERAMYTNMNDYLEKVLVPNMLIKLRQGVGRLIRGERDTGVISILDTRAGRNGKYHHAVVGALPECQMASGTKDIRRFLIDKKDDTFFE